VFPLFCEDDIVACEMKGNKEPDMNYEKQRNLIAL
jgi:hypothetical protein